MLKKLRELKKIQKATERERLSCSNALFFGGETEQRRNTLGQIGLLFAVWFLLGTLIVLFF